MKTPLTMKYLDEKLRKLEYEISIVAAQQAAINDQTIKQETRQRDGVLTRFLRWRRQSCIDDCIIVGLAVFISTVWAIKKGWLPVC